MTMEHSRLQQRKEESTSKGTDHGGAGDITVFGKKTEETAAVEGRKNVL
jgi:hypothetical protein